MNEWMIAEAKRCQIDGAVILSPPGNRQSQSGTLLTALALQRAGVPSLILSADMVDMRGWDRQRVVQQVSQFILRSGLQ